MHADSRADRSTEAHAGSRADRKTEVHAGSGADRSTEVHADRGTDRGLKCTQAAGVVPRDWVEVSDKEPVGPEGLDTSARSC